MVRAQMGPVPSSLFLGGSIDGSTAALTRYLESMCDRTLCLLAHCCHRKCLMFFVCVCVCGGRLKGCCLRWCNQDVWPLTFDLNKLKPVFFVCGDRATLYLAVRLGSPVQPSEPWLVVHTVRPRVRLWCHQTRSVQCQSFSTATDKLLLVLSYWACAQSVPVHACSMAYAQLWLDTGIESAQTFAVCGQKENPGSALSETRRDVLLHVSAIKIRWNHWLSAYTEVCRGMRLPM